MTGEKVSRILLENSDSALLHQGQLALKQMFDHCPNYAKNITPLALTYYPYRAKSLCRDKLPHYILQLSRIKYIVPLIIFFLINTSVAPKLAPFSELLARQHCLNTAKLPNSKADLNVARATCHPKSSTF